MRSAAAPAHGIQGNGRGDLVLITGGGGFIGSHVADLLLKQGYRVRALDNLSPQVHGEGATRPPYLDKRVELVKGDVRDHAVVATALEGVDVVFHFAAAVGVGQSMYEIEHYTSVNSIGTSVLLEAIRKRAGAAPRLIVASSMSVYGEGLYQTAEGGLIETAHRAEQAARAGEWECRNDGSTLTPIPTPEWKRPSLASVYALNKFEQEQKCLIFGRAYDVPVVALRFFNVYGPRQALSNPYTGVIAIFASRLLNDRPPIIFEDGLQRRDFVSVYDVAQACALAITSEEAPGHAINIGSGNSVTVREIAEALGDVLDRGEIEPAISGEYRAGDVRHCFADISRARELLGYKPQWTLRDGLADLAEWLRRQSSKDGVDSMLSELRERGLTSASRSVVQRNGNGHAAPQETPQRHESTPLLNGHARKRGAARYLVTGGCGFIGVNVVQRLAERGERVRVLDNFARNGSRENAQYIASMFGSNVELIEGDIRDRNVVRAAVRGVDRVLHLAAQVAVTCSLDDPMHDFTTNVAGTLNLLEALRRHRPQAHLIFASTNKVYGDLAGLSIRREASRYWPSDPMMAQYGVDEANLSFHSPYGCSKGAADQYVLDYARSFGLLTTVFRMSCIYGVRQRGNEDQGWVAHFVRSALARRPITIYGDGRQVRDLLYVGDLVDAYETAWRMPEATAGEAFNIGGGPDRAVSLLEFVHEAEQLLGTSIALDFKPWRTGDQRYYVSDVRKIRRAIGWQPRVRVEAGVALLRDWLVTARAQENGAPSRGTSAQMQGART